MSASRHFSCPFFVAAWLALAVAWPCCPAPAPALATHSVPSRRQQYLEELTRCLPPNAAWSQWQKTSGELPPDFQTMPSVPFLSDPIRFADGRAATVDTWVSRRLEILRLLQQHVLGVAPASPGNVRSKRISAQKEANVVVEHVMLEFGPDYGARLPVELLLPAVVEPMPVLVLPAEHRRWATIAVSRGYAVCLYQIERGPQDLTDSWRVIWPGQDWTRVTRHAWAVSRCTDFLHTQTWTDTNRIAVGGHGAHASVALVAGAFDWRLDAFVVSSPSPGWGIAFRLAAESNPGGTLEAVTRLTPTDFHPRLRFFAGREAKLPVDQHFLVASLAPRPCLLSAALHEPHNNPWALEHTIRSARRTYALNRAEPALALQERSDNPELTAADYESFMDWFDTAFGHGYFPFPDNFVYPTFESWHRAAASVWDPLAFPTNAWISPLNPFDGPPIETPVAWFQVRPSLRDRIFVMLGEVPDFAMPKPTLESSTPTDMPGPSRPELPLGVQRQVLRFGNGLSGDLYLPSPMPAQGARLAAVLWLHPFAPASGCQANTGLSDLPAPVELARRGLAALTFDALGCGSRLEEIRYFYNRYPAWTLAGKQVDDALAALEALLGIEFLDPQRILIAGVEAGAWVALHAAALEDQVAGVVIACEWMPWRLERSDDSRGGLARKSHWIPWLPTLGMFIREETRIPYDLQDLLALLAPRPVRCYVPYPTEASRTERMGQCLDFAGEVYQLLGARTNLQWHTLQDYGWSRAESRRKIYDAIDALARGAVMRPAEPKR